VWEPSAVRSSPSGELRQDVAKNIYIYIYTIAAI